MLKRLWDTENKKMVFVKWPSWHDCQVWTDADGSHLYIYDCSQWLAYNPAAQWAADAKEYWPTWKALDDETVGFYDTNVPTDLYNRNEGDEVAYAFKNGTTTLQSGKVTEWQTPTYTWATPTKAATAQYTYTFDDWDPEVGPIYKKTNFKATFTSTVNQYTVTFVDEDGTTELDEQTLDYGATPVYAGETPTKESTAQYTYTFSGWTPTIATVTWDATYTATYEATPRNYTITIEPNDDTMGSVSTESVVVAYGTAISASWTDLTIWWAECTATAEDWYVFVSYNVAWESLPETVTWDLTITATFEAVL